MAGTCSQHFVLGYIGSSTSWTAAIAHDDGIQDEHQHLVSRTRRFNLRGTAAEGELSESVAELEVCTATTVTARSRYKEYGSEQSQSAALLRRLKTCAYQG